MKNTAEKKDLAPTRERESSSREISVAIERAIVVAATVLLLLATKEEALSERGYTAIGGECLLLVLPAIYCAGKKIVKDIAADIREYRKGSDHEHTL